MALTTLEILIEFDLIVFNIIVLSAGNNMIICAKIIILIKTDNNCHQISELIVNIYFPHINIINEANVEGKIFLIILMGER